jgi:hypothetical protein
MNRKRLCPTCKTNYMSGWKSVECRQCYLKSDRFLDQLRRNASKANIAANQARWGEQQANDWRYSGMSPALAYIIGTYLTDGWINIKRHTLGLDVTSETFAIYFTDCLRSIGLKPANEIRTKHGLTHKGKLPVHRTHVYSRTLCSWLKESCADKTRIPQQIFDAAPECQMSFICGAIDGDGMISNEGGSIAIYGCSLWMSELPALLARIDIRTTGYHFIKALPSGKRFHSVRIRREDFLERNGFSAVSYKQENLMNRPPRTDRTKHDTCPNCGKSKCVKSKLCAQCHFQSNERKEHMRSISAMGNAKRWGHS